MNGVGAVIDSMTSRKSGHIINMSSDAGRRVSKHLNPLVFSSFTI